MAGIEVHTNFAPDSRPQKTVISLTAGMVDPEVARGKARRCIDWIIGRSFVAAWLILARQYESRDVSPEGYDHERDRRGSD